MTPRDEDRLIVFLVDDNVYASAQARTGEFVTTIQKTRVRNYNVQALPPPAAAAAAAAARISQLTYSNTQQTPPSLVESPSTGPPSHFLVHS